MTKEDLFDLIKDAGYGVLGTVADNQPKVRPMMPYLNDEGNLLLAVVPNSRTINQIKINPLIEICFIDRKMNFARVSGTAQISKDSEKKTMVWDNNPMLRQYFSGPNDSSFTLIEIITNTVEVMTPQDKDPEVLTLK